MLRCVALLLSLWLPLQGVAASLLHDHGHEQASTQSAHLLHGHGTDTASDAGEHEACGTCAIAHAFCHLALSPGIPGTTRLPALEGRHCLHAAPLLEPASAPTRTPLRPPLARA